MPVIDCFEGVSAEVITIGYNGVWSIVQSGYNERAISGCVGVKS